ncbi:hypothetical protein [Massilia genomosp. 1]|uniref:Chorismate mutase n=1 Tax=Massilia genomosp. 1 TaxID=2609280 RepID=A0ABX0MNV3_9BURK|nr:hypothetical protein [Massilia genomosp. 1]NHZ61683.1 hypothetical protein [Massilia genomosp. 1]
MPAMITKRHRLDDTSNDSLKALAANGTSPQDMIALLFSQRCAIAAAIVAIRASYGMTLAEAKRLVAANEHYAAVHDANLPLHDALARHAGEGGA